MCVCPSARFRRMDQWRKSASSISSQPVLTDRWRQMLGRYLLFLFLPHSFPHQTVRRAHWLKNPAARIYPCAPSMVRSGCVHLPDLVERGGWQKVFCFLFPLLLKHEVEAKMFVLISPNERWRLKKGAQKNRTSCLLSSSLFLWLHAASFEIALALYKHFMLDNSLDWEWAINGASCGFRAPPLPEKPD